MGSIVRGGPPRIGEARLGATNGLVLLECCGQESEWLAVWSEAGGLRALGGDGSPVTQDEAWIVGVRLVWTTFAAESGVDLYGSVPLSLLDDLP